MTREEKAVVIEELTTKLKDNPFFYITDASGMTVDETNKLRELCFQKGIEYKVVKNSLIAKALERLDNGTDYSGEFTDKVLKGFSGIMMHPESGSTAAKLIKEFRKKNNPEKPALKGASVDADLFIGESNLEMLSTLKSKNDLIADVVALLQSPAKNVVSALQSGKDTLAGLVKTLADRES